MLRLAWVAVIWATLWVLAWMALPPLLRSQGEKIASEALGREVRIARVEFAPWSLELTIHGLQIARQAGAAQSSPQFSVDRIYANVEAQSLWRRALVVLALQIDGPQLSLTQLQPGVLDIQDIIDRLAPRDETPEPAPSEPGRFALYNLAVQGGSLDVTDASVQRQYQVRDLTLGLPFISSLPQAREIKVLPHLSFSLDGSRFTTEASATPFDPRQETRVQLRIQDLDLTAFSPYLAAALPLRLQQGHLGADLTLAFVQQGQAQVHIQGGLQVQGLRLADAQDAPLLSWESLAVDMADVEPLARAVRLSRLQLDGLQVMAERDAQGVINWTRIAPASKAESKPQSKPQSKKADGPEPAPWQLALDTLALRGAHLHWRDSTLGQPLQWAINDLTLDAQALALPLSPNKAARFSADMRWAGGGDKSAAAQLALQGEVDAEKAQVAASLRGAALAWAAPYVQPLMKTRLDGVLDADIGAARHGPAWAAQIARLSLDGLALSCPAGEDCGQATLPALDMREASSLAEIKRLAIEGVGIDGARERVQVGQITITQPRLRVGRDKQGQWMAQHWLPAAAQAAPAVGAPAPAPSSAPPWAVHLGALEVDGGSVALQDAMPATPVALQLHSLRLRLADFAPLAQGVKPSALEISARVGAGRRDPGRLAYDGLLGIAPLLAQGEITATALPLHALEPYVGDLLNVQVRRADGSFKGHVDAQARSDGLHVQVKGDAAIEALRVRSEALTSAMTQPSVLAQAQSPAEADADTQEETASSRATPSPALGLRRNNDLLRCKSLDIQGLQLRIAPGQPTDLQISAIGLQDFFARIIVQDNGRLNLQEILKQAPAAEAAEATEAATAQAASTETPPAPPTPPAAPPALVRIGPIAMANGRVEFSDYFIKPNYSADLSALTGRLGAFSSQPPAEGAPLELAALELRGLAQSTAQLEITGAINPLAQPLALDIAGKVRDLEMPPLSPYAIKYAGHGIERGKLSVDVAYKIQPDGQLTAENKIVLKQLTFGEPVEGAPASLPVRLATALLSDSNGVIDLDLPLNGSLNDPQFRIGPVIFKILGNIIVKAVTAPFTLLAKAFGAGSQDLSSIAFAPGSADLSEATRAALDQVAQALQTRPTLTLSIIGQARMQDEREGWKQAQLRAMAQQQKRRAAQRETPGQAVGEATPVSDEEWPALLKEVYRRADIVKPRNLVGLVKDLPTDQMQALLLANIAVPDDAMYPLALDRSIAVRDYLAAHQVPMDRIFINAVDVEPQAKDWTPRVVLSLELQ